MSGAGSLQRTTPVLDILLYLVCAGIFYGSLFPFNFSLAEASASFETFLSSWSRLPGRGDILGNIFLFTPFGFLAGLGVRRGGRSNAWVAIVWLLVALGSQVLQLFLPSRDPAIFDLYTNAAGALAGYLAARVLPVGVVRTGGSHYGGDYVPLCLAALWLAWELLPFVPSIDLQSYKSALKPLLVTPHFTWYESLLQAVGWFAVLYMLDRVSDGRLRPLHVLAVMALVLVLKVVIILNSVAVTDVVAMLVGFSAWMILRRGAVNHMALAVLLMLSWWLDAVSPWAIRPSAEGFSWVPFSGFLEGSMLVNVIALCRKGFFFGAIIWLVLRGVQRPMPVLRAAAAALLLLEVLQMFLYAGHPEITDPLLFLAIAWIIRHVDAAASVKVATKTGAEQRPRTAVVTAGRRGVLFLVAAYVIASCLALTLLLSLPGVPYNVIELFRFGGNGVDFVFFSLGLLSIGWGGAWFGRRLCLAPRPMQGTLAGFFTFALVTFLLLWLGVSQESIRDIAGSTVFVHRVMERGVLGDVGTSLFGFLGPQNVHAVMLVIEPVIRFTALLAPLYIFLGLCATRLWRNQSPPPLHTGAARTVVISATLIALLLLAKVIAFDWSSTDNLNELIARDGDWGLGGGGYLYLLVLLLCAVAVYLVGNAFLSPARMPWALLLLVLSLPLSWCLLNSGLEQNVQKYGRTFSGVDFLLGPDRDNLVTTQQLFLRWTLAHTIATVGIAFGAALCVAWFRGVALAADGEQPAPLAQDIEREHDEFRVYVHQAQFLQQQSSKLGSSVGDVINDILAYFDCEMAESPSTVEAVRGYLARSRSGHERQFAPRGLRATLTPAALRALDLVDPEERYSRSRRFRKLLEIYMEAQEGQGSATRSS